MSAFDDMQDKTKDVTKDPDKMAKIEQMAKDKGISIESAKAQFEQNDNKN